MRIIDEASLFRPTYQYLVLVYCVRVGIPQRIAGGMLITWRAASGVSKLVYACFQVMNHIKSKSPSIKT